MSEDIHEDSSGPNEGTGIAAFDLADARFRLHDNEGRIHAEELAKKICIYTFLYDPTTCCGGGFYKFL